MFPTDYDFRRYAIAQDAAKRIAAQIAPAKDGLV